MIKLRQRLSQVDSDMLELPKLREYVRTFIKKCPCCQKMSVIKLPINARRYTLAAYEPMQRVYIDTINLNKPDTEGNQHIIVVVDAFTRWTELYPSKDLTALSAAKALLQFTGRYGIPNEIHCDLGTQYVNSVTNELQRLFGITFTFNISAHSHEENALVERTNKEVMRHLRAIIFDKNVIADWSINLPMVQRIINASVNSSTGTTPAALLFGNAIQLDKGLFLKPVENTKFPPSDWFARRLVAQDVIIRQAQQIQHERDVKHMKQNLPCMAFTEYAVGDYVLVDYPQDSLKPGPPSKLMTHRRGPLRVLSKSEDFYTLQNLVNNKEEVVHLKRLNPFYFDPLYVDPRQVANHDSQHYDIDCVLQHKGSAKRPSFMEFLVRWMSIGDTTEQTWEPWSGLRDTKALHNFEVPARQSNDSYYSTEI